MRTSHRPNTGSPNGTVSTNVTFNGSYNVPVNYLGTSLSDADILRLVQDAKTSSALPSVSNAIYFVFTAPGISEAQDSSACGWHSGDRATSTVYAWVGPDTGCDFLATPTSPVGSVSGSPVGDEVTETGSHELFESLTDPFPSTGFNDNDPTHGEIGDVCTTSNFAGNLNGVQVDLQAIWTLSPNGSATGGACSQGVTFSQVTSSPEPASGTIVLAGCAALAGWRTRRRARVA